MGNIGDVFNYGTKLISGSIIPLIFTLAAVLFVWGVVKFFIINADEEAKRTQGKQFMIWGIVAFVVISSVWALVAILGGTLRINTRVLPGIVPSHTLFINPSTTTPGGGGSGSGGGSTGGGGGGIPTSCSTDSECPIYGQYCGSDGYCH
ncbi:MAG: hypothetical protein KGL67_02830 [Patescibacteria group bacterium]|nr:hypothetical protein [Patescibacteria group bacterium]